MFVDYGKMEHTICIYVGIGGNMKITVMKPNTITFKAVSEKADKYSTKCLWALVTFDLDNWIMSAQSDAGEYSYRWSKEKDRTFLELMAVLNKHYLLGKIAKRDFFNIEETKENICELVRKDDNLEEWQRHETLEEILNISNNLSVYEFSQQTDEIDIVREYDLLETDVYDYPMSAEIFVNIFVDEIIPAIKEYIYSNKVS